METDQAEQLDLLLNQSPKVLKNQVTEEREDNGQEKGHQFNFSKTNYQ